MTVLIATVLVSAMVSYFVARGCMTHIDRYVQEVVEELRKIVEQEVKK